MNSSTLRGIFPEPKPTHRRNFVRENVRRLKDMQGYIQDLKQPSKSQEIKQDKFKHVAPRVYSTMTTKQKLSDDSMSNKPRSNQIPRNIKLFHPSVRNKQEKNEQKSINKCVQTERPEDVPRLYETGTLKYPSPSIVKQTPHKGQDQGDAPSSKNVIKSMQKLDLDEKQNYIKQNIKNIKTNRLKQEETSDPLLPPANYTKGALPKYLKEKPEPKEVAKPVQYEADNLSGLVLLPDEERKEYLRVARENYAALIKELNSMPVSNDTLRKRKRKIEIEEELNRLEEVIKIFQKPKVFVKADA